MNSDIIGYVFFVAFVIGPIVAIIGVHIEDRRRDKQKKDEQEKDEQEKGT